MPLTQLLCMSMCTSSHSCGRSPPTRISTGEFSASRSISLPFLRNLIKEQQLEYPFECIEAQITVKKTVHQQHQNSTKEFAAVIRVVKTDSRNFYKPPSYSLYGGLNGLSESLQHFYTLCGCVNGLSVLLQASYMLCGDQNGLFALLQASYTLCGG